ncbi:PKD domain-containing protein [Deinococcus radiotolerans]|nr:PKD domain-containing protein [Deinococcus radiotolerans]
MNWADGVDTWVGDGSPNHTFQHVYRLASPGTFLYTSSISSKFTVTTYAGTHTENDLGYQISHVISLPTVSLNTPATTTALTDVSLTYNDLVVGRTYTVNWGDGTAQPLVGTTDPLTVTHQYRKDGLYQITTVGSNNFSNTAPLNITVKSPPPTFTATGATLTATLAFSGLQSDTDYTVDWGDGSSTSLLRNTPGQQPTHVYSAPGPYTIRLYGPVPPAGTGVLATTTFTATLGAVTLSAAPQRPVVGEQVVVTLTGLAESATYQLNWGDGAVESVTGQTSTSRSHAYAAVQDYTITVTNAGRTLGTTAVAVQVPTPLLTLASQGLTVTLQAQRLVAGATYTVNWGEGTPEPLTATGTSATLTHAYARPGTYAVTVTPARGLPATDSVTVIAAQPRLTLTPPVADTDQTVTAAMADLIATLQYTLDWKDGTAPVTFTATGPQATQTHAFSTPGTYQVELTAAGVNPTTAPATVRPGTPTLSLTADTLTATLTVSRLITGVLYTIDWGAGVTERFTATGPAMTFTHTYSAPGTQTVTVTPDGGVAATASVTVTVPVPTLSVTPAAGVTDTAFTATLGTLVPSLTYTLAWGDGATETITGVRTFTRGHTYVTPGSFTVTLSTQGAAPVTQTVTVRVPAPVLSAVNTNLTLSVQVSRLVKGATYRVQWGDTQEQTLTAAGSDTTLTHSYAAPGSYTVTVTPDLGDAVSLTVDMQYVSVAAPTLTVTPVTATVYAEVRADFSGLIPSLTYTLDWGDGQRDTVTGVAAGQQTHTYPRAGTYAVSLKAPQSAVAMTGVTITQPVPVVTGTSTALDAQVTVTGLVRALTYRLEWGDGTPAVDLTGVDSRTVTHTYGRPGLYTVTLSVPNGAPVTTTLTVTVAAATLSAVSDALTVTASVAGLEARLAYTLSWGDGSSSVVSGKAADTLTHTYARPGTFTLSLTTPGTAPVTTSVAIQVKALTVVVVAPELRANAVLSGLLSSLTYTVNWGDGQQDTVSGLTSTTLVHTYLKPGQYTVTVTAPGLDPVTTTFTAGLPPQEVITPTPGSSPDVLDIRITGLLTGANYLLDYGDGQVEQLAFTGQSGRWTHRYARTGLYTLTLNLRTPDGVTSVRTITTVQAQLQLALKAATVAFEGGAPNATLTLKSLDPVAVRLTVEYTGSGSLTGTWLLDGQAGPTVTLNLPDGSTTATATYTVSPPRPGSHTLSFQIADVTTSCAAACPAPTLPGANTVRYTLDSPSVLQYGGLDVTVTSVTNLNLQTFAGEGTVRLIVGGLDLGYQRVTMTNLQVTRSEAGYKVTGGDPTRVNLQNLALRLLSLGQADVRLTSMTLRADGAALSGTVQLPGGAGGTGTGLTFTDAPLQDGGELLADLKGTASSLGVLTIGTTGISVSAGAGVLDLSSKQNAPGLSSAYAADAAPTLDWKGVVLPGAGLTVGAPIVSGTPSSVSGLVAYTLGGYATAFEITSTGLSVGGWAIKSGPLNVTVAGSAISGVSGHGSLTVPMVNEPLDVTISWNPQLGNPGAKWEVTSGVAVANHNFGRTSLALGRPSWEFGGDGKAKLVFSDAKWNLGGVSGAEVKLPLYNLTFTTDGGVSLNGETWASATGLTNLSLFDYPFPAAEVGARREADGQYTLSLRGKLQLAEALPLNAVAQPISFWVKDGKDVKIVIDKIRIFGQTKTVDYDVSVSAMFKDENTLEFIGEGSIKIAKKIAVATKAGFGRDNGTSYGFFWASVASSGLKPFVTVGSVGFYEFSGGVGINMVWKDGNFDAPPVKAIPPAGATRAVNVAIQAGTVFGTAIDNGTTAHFRGTLGVDSEGTVAIKAVGWLFTPLQLGALGTYSSGVASAAGGNLSTVSTKGSLSPQVAAMILLSVPPENPESGYLLVQGCVGPAARSSVGGLDCTLNRELDFYGIVSVSGYAEMYMPFSGSGQRVYLGTKANPISVRLLSMKSGSTTTTTTKEVKNADGTVTPATTGTTANTSSNTAAAGTSNTTTSRADGIGYNGYLMVDGTKTSVGVGMSMAYSVGQSGTGAICDWFWYANAHLALNADFTVTYDPTSLDASVTLSAGAAAGAGACGVRVDVGINMSITGRLYVSAASSFIDGTASGTVIMPVIPNIPFSVSGRVNF